MNFVKNLLTRTSRCMENQESDYDVTSPGSTRSSRLRGSKSSCRSPASKLSEAPAPLFGRCDSENSSTATPDSDEEVALYGDVVLDIQASIEKVSDTRRWRDDRFQKIRLLQNAARNQGRVELLKDLSSGKFVAVKRMPISWTGHNHEDFLRRHVAEVEMPWVDVALVRYLSTLGANFVCNSLGTFQSDCETFFVSKFAEKGDLFEWSQNGAHPGPQREIMLRPLVRQLVEALSFLHRLDIAHCDLSLENILLMSEGNSLHIKLIDFGMAAVQQPLIDGARGKPSYQAPEMHKTRYDPRVSDVFAAGVVIFGMAAQDYPWLSTKPGGCKCFDFASTKGLRAYMQKRKARNSNGARLAEVFSETLVELLEKTCAFRPEDRARLDGDLPWVNG